MKAVTLLLGLVVCVLLNACAVAEQGVGDVGEQFQNGIQGRGRIVPNNATEDSFGPEYR